MKPYLTTLKKANKNNNKILFRLLIWVKLIIKFSIIASVCKKYTAHKKVNWCTPYVERFGNIKNLKNTLTILNLDFLLLMSHTSGMYIKALLMGNITENKLTI